MSVDTNRLQSVARGLLLAIGEDPDREGLKDTPRRFAQWWQEFIDYDPGKTDTTFEAINTGGMVIVTGIRVWSICEHHLLPFSCEIGIGYLPRDHVLGLSKFARIAHEQAHKLQIQERMTKQIADAVATYAMTYDVIVVGKGEHLCGTMRGIKTPMQMKTQALRGAFYTGSSAIMLRREFYDLAGW